MKGDLFPPVSGLTLNTFVHDPGARWETMYVKYVDYDLRYLLLLWIVFVRAADGSGDGAAVSCECGNVVEVRGGEGIA